MIRNKRFKSFGIIVIVLGLGVLCSDVIYNRVIEHYRDKAIKESEIVVDRTKLDKDSYDETSLVSGSNFAVSGDQDVKVVESYKNVVEIENLGIKAYVFDDLSHDSLTYGVGRYPETPKLGEFGNTVIAGHSSNIYNCILNNIKDIKIFDVINIYDGSGNLLKYYVVDKFIINPSNVDILKTTDESIKELTIITCTSSGAQRLIVKAQQLSDSELSLLKESVQQENKGKLLSINDSIKLFDFKSIFKERNKPTKLIREVVYTGSPYDIISTVRNMNVIIGDDLECNEHLYNSNFDIGIGVDIELKE